MLSIVRCPECGKAAVAVGSRNRARVKCSRCGRPLGESSAPSWDAEKLADRAREVSRRHMHAHRGLGRPR